jgi:type III pantothenate kinase
MNAQVKRLLTVDVGNTRMKFGVMGAGPTSPGQLPPCQEFIAVLRSEPPPWSTLREWLRVEQSTEVVIAGSHAKQIAELVSEWPADLPQPHELTERKALPIVIDVDQPERVGIDRLLNAVAVNVFRTTGEPSIVIDIGTATTVDAIAPDGAFLGGTILAGPELSARALHEYTAVLPLVTLGDLTDGAPACIGRNTWAAIRSGLYWGHWQSVWGLSEQMKQSQRWPPVTQIVLTGGAADVYADRLPAGVRYEPHLTLQGLAVAMQATPADGPSSVKE